MVTVSGPWPGAKSAGPRHRINKGIHMEEIKELRKKIDGIDKEVVRILGKRFKLTQKIGKIKLKEKITVVDNNRWQKVIEQLKDEATKNDLNQNMVVKIYNIIHKYSIMNQKKGRNDEKS